MPVPTTILWAVLSAVTALLAIVALAAWWLALPVAYFTRDPAVILDGEPFVGLVSSVGVLFWTATFSVCLFSAVLLRKSRHLEAASFCAVAGLFSMILVLDDLFMGHEKILRWLVGLPEEAAYLGYAILLLLFYWRFRQRIQAAESGLLYLSGLFFLLSIVCDTSLPQIGWEYLAEDGLKLFGIVCWFLFFTRACLQQFEQPSPGAAASDRSH